MSALLSTATVVFDINILWVLGFTLLILRFLYRKCAYPELIRRLFVLLGLVLVFGACINMFSKMYTAVFLKDGRIYGVMSLGWFVLSVSVCCVILRIFLFFIKHRKILYKVQIEIDEEIINTTALLDSGNRLREPNTKRPVIIIEDTILKHEHKTDIIFLKTAGRECENMDIVYVKSLTLLEENKRFEDLYAGVSRHSLSKNGEFCALLHSELI